VNISQTVVNEPVYQVTRMDERLSNSVAERRFQTLLLGHFAGIALVIATVGIYGVISYPDSRRMHEIGVRMALGAQRSDVLQIVIWRGMRLTLIGVTLGLAAAFALTRVLKNLLFEVTVTDPLTFAVIALLLILVALLACIVPARLTDAGGSDGCAAPRIIPMTDSTSTTRFRFWLWLIRFVGLILPRRLRAGSPAGVGASLPDR
jgi:ABC-type antimicrobial peptide transport system permease subunit